MPTRVSQRAAFTPKISHGRSISIRIMRPYNTAREASNTTAEDHSSPALRLHGRHTQLRQEECRPTISAPCILEIVDGNICNGLDPGFAEGGAGVVEENGGCPEGGRDCGVEAADLDRKRRVVSRKTISRTELEKRAYKSS